MTHPTLKPVDQLTPHELRIECLERTGWTHIREKEDYCGTICLVGCSFGMKNIAERCPDPTANIADAMAALDKLIEAGVIDYVEITNFKLDDGFRYWDACFLKHLSERDDDTDVFSSGRSESNKLAITRAAVAALREQQQ